jgi:glutamate-ammonia-ligase adenylyltransferase
MLAAHDILTRLLVTLRLVAPDAAPPGPPTQALIARALGLHDWPAVLAGLAEVRQQVTAFWHELTGEQDG